jgi:hypothetical protein
VTPGIGEDMEISYKPREALIKRTYKAQRGIDEDRIMPYKA